MNRLNDLNFIGYPSVFYDAGDNVSIGGITDENIYRASIEASGNRAVPNLDLIVKIDFVSGTTYDITVKIGNEVSANNAPMIPTTVVGPTDILLSEANTYRAASTDATIDDLYYQFDWGNGAMSAWLGPYNSGDSVAEMYAWSLVGDYDVKVRSKDDWDATSNWSPLYTVSVSSSCCVGIRGNVNGDMNDSIDISDLVVLVAFMFQNGADPSCIEEANIDGMAGIDISDLVVLVAFMFQNGPDPAVCP